MRRQQWKIAEKYKEITNFKAKHGITDSNEMVRLLEKQDKYVGMTEGVQPIEILRKLMTKFGIKTLLWTQLRFDENIKSHLELILWK